MWTRTTYLIGSQFFGLGFLASSAAADDTGPNADGITIPSITTSLPENGDPGGRRRELAAQGITVRFNYTNDVLANVDGGLKRGAIDQGLLESIVMIDLEKAVGWRGLTYYSNVFQIHDTGRMLLCRRHKYHSRN
jgi:porin